jgi:hypothetical protein
VLTVLWLNEDFIENFDVYIAQLTPAIDPILLADVGQLKAEPSGRNSLMRLFYILRGIVSGLNSPKHFALFFDWFYPDYFQVIGKALSVFIEDDELVVVIFKFIQEMVNNRCSRLRFDAWNINGLIVFKETAKLVVQYL